MEPNNIIAAFLEVVETQDYIFDQQSREDLKTIKQTLTEVENQPLQVAAEAITNWCKEHEAVRDAVFFTATTTRTTIRKRNPATLEGTITNSFSEYFPEYKEKIDAQINNTQPQIEYKEKIDAQINNTQPQINQNQVQNQPAENQ
jgi:hypothetical protein